MIKIYKTTKMCSIATAAILPPPPSFLCSDGGQVVHVDRHHNNHDNDDHNHLHKHHNHDYDDHHHNHDDDAQTVCRFVMMIMIMIIQMMLPAVSWKVHCIKSVFFSSGENGSPEQAPLLPLLLLHQLLLLHVLLLLLLPHPTEEHQEEWRPNHEDGGSLWWHRWRSILKISSIWFSPPISEEERNKIVANY